MTALVARFALLCTLASTAFAARCSCPNGTPVFGPACTTDGAIICMFCSNGFHLTADHACEAHRTCGADEYVSFAGSSFSDAICQQKLCVCPDGVPTVGAACATHGAASCASCSGARHLENGDTTCELNTCHCDNGTAATAASGHFTAHKAEKSMVTKELELSLEAV